MGVLPVLTWRGMAAREVKLQLETGPTAGIARAHQSTDRNKDWTCRHRQPAKRLLAWALAQRTLELSLDLVERLAASFCPAQ